MYAVRDVRGIARVDNAGQDVVRAISTQSLAEEKSLWAGVVREVII